MHHADLMQCGHCGNQHLGPGHVVRPEHRLARGRGCRQPVALALGVKHLLQVGAVLDEFIGLEIAAPAPGLLESIQLAHREMRGGAAAHPGRQLLLVGH